MNKFKEGDRVKFTYRPQMVTLRVFEEHSGKVVTINHVYPEGEYDVVAMDGWTGVVYENELELADDSVTLELKLKIVDVAIDLIEGNAHNFSCVALMVASYQLGVDMDLVGDEYEEFNRDDLFRLPDWWNQGREFKAERIAALKAFRQHLIDEGS